MEPVVTIDLKQYNELVGLKKYNETLLDIASREMYREVMTVLRQQNINDAIEDTFKVKQDRPYVHFDMPYDEFKKHYISE